MKKDIFQAIDLCPTNPELAYRKAEEIFRKSVLDNDDASMNDAKMVMAHSAQFLGMYAISYQLATECLYFFENQNADYQTGYVLNTMGFIYNYFGDHKSRLDVNLKSLNLRKKTGDLDGYIRSLNNTGDTYISIGEYDKAIDLLKECLSLTPKENLRMRCVAQANLGEALFYLNDFETATKHFDVCLKLGGEISNDSLIFTCQRYMAMMHMKTRNFDVSKKHLDDAAQTLLKLPAISEEQAQYNKELANYYELIGKYSESVKHFKRFYSLEEQIKTEKQQREIKSIQHSVEIKELKSQKYSLEELVKERSVKLENTLKELSTKEAFNKKILHSARTAIVVFDEVGIVTDFNPAAKSLLSIEKEMNIAQFIRFKTESFFEDVLSNLFAPNMMDLGEFEYEMMNQSEDCELFLDVSFTQVDDDPGKKGIAFINDVTFQVLTEKERKKDLETEITINHFAQSLFKANSISEVLWGVVEGCISLLDFEDCYIYLIHEDKNELVQTAAYSSKKRIDFDLKNPINIPFGKGIVGTVAKNGLAEIVEDTSTDNRYIPIDEIRFSEITVPIKLNDQVIGVIDSEHPEKNFYNERHLRILATISKLAGNRLDKLHEQEAKEALQVEILKMNESLEEQVNIKTKENILLNKQIAEKEKSLLMAEMSSLLSHELNTPLANIQNASLAIKETIQQKSTIKTQLENQINFSIRERLIDSINAPARLISSRVLRKEEALINEYIATHKLDHLKSSIPEIVRLNLLEEEMLIALNKIEGINHLLNMACYEKSISTFIHILNAGVSEISRVVEEVKSIESLESNDEMVQFNLYDAINFALQQHPYDFNFKNLSNELFSIELFGHPDKLTQLWNGMWKITEEFTKIDTENSISLDILENEKSIQLIIDIPTTSIDFNFFTQTRDFNSFTNLERSLRVRLSILKTILEEHHAKMTFETNENKLAYAIEFSKTNL